MEFETVFETSDPDLVPVIKSLLDAAEIPYVTEGEGLMNLFPTQALGTLMSKPHAQVVIRVPPDRADEARELLVPEAEGVHPEDA